MSAHAYYKKLKSKPKFKSLESVLIFAENYNAHRLRELTEIAKGRAEAQRKDRTKQAKPPTLKAKKK